MIERACGIHALDAAPHDACPHCTRARIQARDDEIEHLRQELAEAREAARWCYNRVYRQEEAREQWPWLTEKAGGAE